MNKKILMLLPVVLCMTGCRFIHRVDNGGNFWGNILGGGDAEDSEAYKSALKKINDKNYHMSYQSRTTAMGMTIPISTETDVDGLYAYVDETDYYDYTKADSQGTYDAYVYNMETNNYTKASHDCSNEPWTSKILTRYTFLESDFSYDEDNDLYVMPESRLSYFDFNSASLEIGSSQLIFKVEADISTSHLEYTATFTRFGQINITLPTNLA